MYTHYHSFHMENRRTETLVGWMRDGDTQHNTRTLNIHTKKKESVTGRAHRTSRNEKCIKLTDNVFRLPRVELSVQSVIS